MDEYLGFNVYNDNFKVFGRFHDGNGYGSFSNYADGDTSGDGCDGTFNGNGNDEISDKPFSYR